jgi:hypothetical protein
MGTSRFDKPYDQRTDAEKVETNWVKTRGLFDREDWSMAVVRAAISLELAADLAVYVILRNQYERTKIKSLLRACRGINKKFKKYILPSVAGTAHEQEMQDLFDKASEVSGQRNQICHNGTLLNDEEAKTLIATAYGVLEPFVKRYEPGFWLKPIRESKRLRTKHRDAVTDESNDDREDMAAVNRDSRF